MSLLPDFRLILLALLLGVTALIIVRAIQVSHQHTSFGYTPYTADRMRTRLLRIGMVGAGLFVVGIGLYFWLSTGHTLLPQRSPREDGAASPDDDGTPADPVFNRLVIPRLGISVDIVEMRIIANNWDITELHDDVGHLEGTAYPGEPGNAVLAGHVTVPDAGFGPFKDLYTLQPGDHIYVTNDADNRLVYEVVRVTEVAPTDVEVTFPTEDTRLTLVTCSGWEDEMEEYTTRVVVVAAFLQEE